MITFREIAQKANIPESTLRLYRDVFESFLPARGEGRRRRYDDATAETLLQIARWRQEGWSKESVARELAQRQVAAPPRAGTAAHVSETVRLLHEQARALARIESALDALRTRPQETPIAFDDAVEAGE